MKIVTSDLYEKQLKAILDLIAQENPKYAKDFKTYLDAVILNIPTKEKKYKKSFYFNDEDIKDIPFQGCTIVFYVDKSNTTYVVLGITAK